MLVPESKFSEISTTGQLDSEMGASKPLMAVAAKYQTPSYAVGMWQVFSTFIPLFLTLAAVWYAFNSTMPYVVTLLLSLIASGLIVRLFMIQHDCGHGSFTPSRSLNDTLGMICSFFTLIPYFYWRRQHAIHHATNGNLDERGHGDMDVLTVREYMALSRWGKIKYRAYRNPFCFLIFGPIFFLLVINRLVLDHEKTSHRDRMNVHWTNLGIVLLYGSLGYLIGYATLAKLMIPITFVAAGAGIWIFYVQHQFEHTYWRHRPEWDYIAASMQGSSFYNLPKVLQWFTSNIGFHHIHHLKPSIPNYRLEACHVENPEFQRVPELTLWSSLKTMFLSVYDEEKQDLISFRELRKRGYTPKIIEKSGAQALACDDDPSVIVTG